MNRASPADRPTSDLVDKLEASLPSPSPNEQSLLLQLRELSERLSAGKLQLAVVGQFKRGKSSLINALIGDELLPSGVLPVTAIPTLIEAGDPALTIIYENGKSEKIVPADAEEMRTALRRFVSEAGNPQNRLNVREVRVAWRSPFLRYGATIIDTPGVGSTLEHNSRTAEAALPQADVALFILSPDPPITKVEADYLATVKTHAARTIILLNKCDLLGDGERSESISFIERELGACAAEILCVSARRALDARRSSDEDKWKSSGVADLVTQLADFLATEKQPALQQAFAKKAARILGDLQLESEVVLRSLELPIAELAGRADALSGAMNEIDEERTRADDLLTGDRKRVIAELRAEAEKIRERVRAALLPELARRVAAGVSPDGLAQELLDRLPPTFASEFLTTRDWLSSRVRSLLQRHVLEAERLVSTIRSAAAAALSMEITGPAAAISVDFDLSPVWYARRLETLIPVPNRTIERLLPARIKHRRATRRISDELGLAINRNVEALRWSLVQATEQVFRRFAREMQDTLNAAEAATRDAVSSVLSRRREQSSAVAPEIGARKDFLRILSAAEQKLADEPQAIGLALVDGS